MGVQFRPPAPNLGRVYGRFQLSHGLGPVRRCKYFLYRESIPLNQFHTGPTNQPINQSIYLPQTNQSIYLQATNQSIN